jgi:hypothetical protein
MTSKNDKMRATLFFFEAYLGAAPTVVSAVNELCDRGYEVDIFYVKSILKTPQPKLPALVNERCCALWSPRLFQLMIRAARKWNALRRHWQRNDAFVLLRRTFMMHRVEVQIESFTGLRKRGRLWLEGMMRLTENTEFALFCRRYYKTSDVVIAFDMTGLWAMSLVVPAGTRFIYWSLEILLPSEARDWGARRLKRREMRMLPIADVVVIQTRERLRLLTQNVRISEQRVVFVPNSPNAPRDPNCRRDFFNELFEIATERTIVLHAGWIDPIFRSLELASACSSWPDDFVLVFHERERRDLGDPYIAAIKKAGGDRVKLSLNPLPLEQIDTVYASASIGLVCFEAIDANFASMLGSTGKLAYYLRWGLPVIFVCTQRPALLDQWDIGLWVSKTEDVAHALEAVKSDYARYSQNAKNYYAECFDFKRAFIRMMGVYESCISGERN